MLQENGYEDKHPFVCDLLAATELKSFCTMEKNIENCRKTCSRLDESITSTTSLGHEGTTQGM